MKRMRGLTSRRKHLTKSRGRHPRIEQWVHATLGEPSSRTGPEEDQIWKYVYTTRTDSHGSVFLIFGGSDVKKTTSEAFIEFRDGVVANKWRAGATS